MAPGWFPCFCVFPGLDVCRHMHLSHITPGSFLGLDGDPVWMWIFVGVHTLICGFYMRLLCTACFFRVVAGVGCGGVVVWGWLMTFNVCFVQKWCYAIDLSFYTCDFLRMKVVFGMRKTELTLMRIYRGMKAESLKGTGRLPAQFPYSLWFQKVFSHLKRFF